MKTPQGFSPISFLWGKKPCGCFPPPPIHCKEIHNFLFFKKPCGVFPPQSDMGEKTRGGNQSMELSHINHFLQLLQSNKVVSCTNFNIYFFWKKPWGVFPPFENPLGVFNFDLFFHYDRIFILGSQYICFTNLRLYLCFKVVLSILYH